MEFTRIKQGNQFFEVCIKEIYDKRLTSNQFSKFIENTDFDIGYGGVYIMIRERLQITCRNHKMLIANSVVSFAKIQNGYHRVSIPDIGDTDDSLLKMYEIITSVIYFHFKALTDSNHQICQLWNILKSKVKHLEYHGENGKEIKTPELRLSTLNYFTLKQLIPSVQQINLSQFKQILVKLNHSPFVAKKDHICELLEVFQIVDAVETPKNNSTHMLIEKRDKQQEGAPEKINNWLEMSKQNPIGKKLCQRLGGKFCIQENEEILISQKDKQDLNMGLLPKNIFNLGTAHQQTQQDNSKKKKKKNKKKKQKMNESEKEQQNENGKQPSASPKISQIINKLKFKQCYEVIKFLEDLNLNSLKRLDCEVNPKLIQQWKKTYKRND